MIVRGSSISPIHFGGLRIFDYTAGKELESSMALIDVPPGARHAEAWSERSDKLYLVVEGELGFVLDGEAAQLGKGDFCFVRRGRRFSYANASARAAKLVLVHTPSFDLASEHFAST
jgi:mannose-6-phosphate isomerase-like protein (cupin superfamily)